MTVLGYLNLLWVSGCEFQEVGERETGSRRALSLCVNQAPTLPNTKPWSPWATFPSYGTGTMASGPV